MFGNQSSNNFRLSNARLIGANCNASNKACEKNSFIDEDFSDYVVKSNIPEMKLLPMDYVSKAKKPSCAPPPPPPAKCKCATSEATKSSTQLSVIDPIPVDKNPMSKNSDKYLVYKKKHSIFGTTASSANEKLQYINGSKKKAGETSTQDPLMKTKENKKKYLIFENKKSSNKLDSIQYYFDNKSYEKYVDNKLYGKINRNLTPEPPKTTEEEMLKGFENSRSWEWRDNSKTETKMKLFESKHETPTARKEKSDGSGSTSGASSCSEISLKRRNCRLKPQPTISESKSICDLSQKTSNDVNRINQIFANAKPKLTNVVGTYEQPDKYKVHRKLNGDNNSEGLPKTHDCKILIKDKPPFTDLKLKTPDVQASCGFTNCQFSHCSVSSLSVTSPPAKERRKNFDENFIRKFEDMKKNNEQRNNEVSIDESSIIVNGKSNITVNGTKTDFTQSAHEDFIINKYKDKIFDSKPNNRNTTTIKINESGFVVKPSSKSNLKNTNQMNRNIIELNCGKTSIWDKNIKLKNNPHLKYDNKIDVNNKIRNEENSVKIYVSGNDSPTGTTLSVSSSQDSSDSDRDYGYFDTSSQGRSSSPEFAEMCKKFRQLCNGKTNLLGCDGALFWNNSYFDDDEIDAMVKRRTEQSSYHCTKCHTTTEDLLSNYICICSNQVINVIIAQKKNAHMK